MKDNKRVDVDGILRSLDKRYNQVKAMPSAPVEPAAVALDALRAGEELLAHKPFTSNDKSYMPGDKFDPADIREDAVARLAKHGYIVPKKLYDQGVAAAAVRDLLNKADPLRMRLAHIRQDVTRAAAKVEAERARLASVESEYNVLVSQCADAEALLAEFLEGRNEDISAMLK